MSQNAHRRLGNPMLRPVLLILFAITIAAGSNAAESNIWDRLERDELALFDSDDPDMVAAMRKARQTLPEFLALARRPRLGMTNFSVKVGLSDKGFTEFFWIGPFRQSGERFTGRIDNTPQSVKTVKRGQTISFGRRDIVDWLYIDGGAMKGNFTVCVSLKREKPEDAESFKRHFRIDCEL